MCDFLKYQHSKVQTNRGTVGHVCNPITREHEVGDSLETQKQPSLHNKILSHTKQTPKLRETILNKIIFIYLPVFPLSEYLGRVDNIRPRSET